jgi:hypothetical protein
MFVASGAPYMSFRHNLCDLRVLGGEYVTAIRAGELYWCPGRRLAGSLFSLAATAG